jgi:hypothetical protein
MSYPSDHDQTETSWGRWPGKLGAFALLLVVYLLTLATTITWAHHRADGGDLVTAVVRGSIPHRPESPTYLLLRESSIHMLWGDPVWRLNVMSAVLAAGVAALTAAAANLSRNSQFTIRNLRRSQPRPGSALLVAGPHRGSIRTSGPLYRAAGVPGASGRASMGAGVGLPGLPAGRRRWLLRG